MQTEKLYYQNSYLRQFEANFLVKTPLAGGRFAVILNQTAFYPEGGGQPCDLGTLNHIPVIDVRTENGEIVHFTSGDPGEGKIQCEINWQRRFDHMQQHTGEHILSGILLAKYQAENVGFHLSANSCQIDVTLPSLSPEQATALEREANAIIFANLPVKAQFVEQADLANFSLRKEPGKEYEQIRLVSVQHCDCCPCGGTHVSQTGDVGLLKIRSWEKRKNNIRLDFVCGGRALADYQLKHEITSSLSTRFSAPVENILAAVERNQEKLETCQADLIATRKAYHEELATSLLSATVRSEKTATSAPRPVISRIFTNYSASDLQDFAARITAVGVICLLASIDSKTGRTSLLFSAAPTPLLPMHELLKQTLAPFGGKGGGNALQAQGGMQNGDAESILAAARELLGNV